MIPYGKQTLDEDDEQAVLLALRSNWLTTGPKVTEFEEAFADRVGADYAVSCSSGTAALHLACLAAGVGPKWGLITSPITFLASANCGRYVGADILFADVRPESITLDAEKLELIDLKGKKPCVVPVHFAGIPCDMEPIREWAEARGGIVIEDACHALGASYFSRGELVSIGACRHSDMTVFSFHPVKHITTGEGGMITTNSKELYEKLKLFRSHGMERNPDAILSKELAFDGEIQNPWFYEMQTPGYNYRLTDIQAALGISQLKKLDQFVARRRELVGHYNDAFKGVPFLSFLSDGENLSSWHLYVVRIDFAAIGKSRREVFEIYKENGIGVQVHYIPLHYQPGFGGRSRGEFPVAEAYYDECLSLPLYPAMEEIDQLRVIEVTLNKVLK